MFSRYVKRKEFVSLFVPVISTASTFYAGHSLSQEMDESQKSTLSNKSSSDCAIPACKSKTDMLQLMKAYREKKDNPMKGEERHSSASTSLPSGLISGCPVDKDELGRSTWNLLHSIAASYSEIPSEVEKHQMIMFFTILSSIYPCPICAEDFAASIIKTPPNVNSRYDLSIWVCNLHNEGNVIFLFVRFFIVLNLLFRNVSHKVNEKLGKPLHKCDVNEIDRRWKYGDSSCWDPDSSS